MEVAKTFRAGQRMRFLAQNVAFPHGAHALSGIDPKLLNQLRIGGEQREDEGGGSRRGLWLALAGVLVGMATQQFAEQSRTAVATATARPARRARRWRRPRASRAARPTSRPSCCGRGSVGAGDRVHRRAVSGGEGGEVAGEYGVAGALSASGVRPLPLAPFIHRGGKQPLCA